MNKIPADQKKNLTSLIIPKNIEILISSTGGVGTTFLMFHINKYKKINNPNDRDQFKHIIFPPLSHNKNIKYVYIFGNPIDSVISLFGRNFHYYHSSKIVRFKNTVKPIPQDKTLEEYASEGIDRFLFYEQFNNWLTLSKFYPTLFLRYEKIWENLETLYDFLEIPREEIVSFPEKKERKSKFSTLDKKTQTGLKNIYGEFEQYLAGFDDCFIVNKKKNSLVPGIFFNDSFYYTARRVVAQTLLNISPAFLNYLENIYFSKRK